MTASDEPESQSGDGRGATGAERDEDADDEPKAGRFDKCVEYALDLLSLV